MLITSANIANYKTSTSLNKNRVPHKIATFSGLSQPNIPETTAIESLKCLIRLSKQSLKYIKDSVRYSKAEIERVSASLKETEFEELPSCIEFIKARTLDEAKNFAKTVLKIDDYKVYDLEICNIVNEGLVNINNLAKGKCPRPKSITHKPLLNPKATDLYDSFDNSKIAQMQNNHLTLNSNLFNEKTYDKQSLLAFLYHEIGHMLDTNNIVSKGYKEILIRDQKSCCNAEIQMIPLEARIKNYEEQLQELINPPKKTPRQKLTEFWDRILHRKPKNIQTNQIKIVDSEPVEVPIKEMTERHWSSDEKLVAKKISDYATTSPTEFIAETFSTLCVKGLAGCPKDTISLYKKYDGPMLDGFLN